MNKVVLHGGLDMAHVDSKYVLTGSDDNSKSKQIKNLVASSFSQICHGTITFQKEITIKRLNYLFILLLEIKKLPGGHRGFLKVKNSQNFLIMHKSTM